MHANISYGNNGQCSYDYFFYEIAVCTSSRLLATLTTICDILLLLVYYASIIIKVDSVDNNKFLHKNKYA